MSMYRALLNEVRGLIENSPAIDRDGRWHSDMAHQSSDENHPKDKQDKLHRTALDANRAELAKEKDQGTRRAIKDRIKGHAAHLGIKDSDEPEHETGAAMGDVRDMVNQTTEPLRAAAAAAKLKAKRSAASQKGVQTKHQAQARAKATQLRAKATRQINKNKKAAETPEPVAKAESLQVIREWAESLRR